MIATLRRTAFCLVIAAFAVPALADPASERALIERVDRLARELEAVKAELARKETELAALTPQLPARLAETESRGETQPGDEEGADAVVGGESR